MWNTIRTLLPYCLIYNLLEDAIIIKVTLWQIKLRQKECRSEVY